MKMTTGKNLKLTLGRPIWEPAEPWRLAAERIALEIDREILKDLEKNSRYSRYAQKKINGSWYWASSLGLPGRPEFPMSRPRMGDFYIEFVGSGPHVTYNVTDKDRYSDYWNAVERIKRANEKSTASDVASARKRDGRCPKCGVLGPFIGLAPTCPEHGVY